jgi:hypothetical protein
MNLCVQPRSLLVDADTTYLYPTFSGVQQHTVLLTHVPHGASIHFNSLLTTHTAKGRIYSFGCILLSIPLRKNVFITCCRYPCSRYCDVVALPSNSNSTTAAAKEQLCGHIGSPATREHAIMEETFSVRLLPRLYDED